MYDVLIEAKQQEIKNNLNRSRQQEDYNRSRKCFYITMLVKR